MKYAKSFIALSAATTLFFSCKKAENTPIENTKTEITAAVTKQPIAPENEQKASFEIEGMTCAMGCAKTIENELTETNGIKEAKVDFDNKTATVIFDKTVHSQESIIKIVQETGDGKTYKLTNYKS